MNPQPMQQPTPQPMQQPTQQVLIKRNNWTNEEVLHLVQYCLGKSHNAALFQLEMLFEDFDLPTTSPGAAAFDFHQDLIVGVGPSLPR